MLERDVKRKVSALFKLAQKHAGLYLWMPVPSGFGKSSLDYIICLQGHFIAVETKAPGEWLTPRQREVSREIMMSGGKVFVVSSQEGFGALERYLVACIPSLGHENSIAYPRGGASW